MGWLGWTPDALASADVNAILAGYEGRIGMIRAVFGGSEEDGPPEKTKAPAMTPNLFRAMFAKAG